MIDISYASTGQTLTTDNVETGNAIGFFPLLWKDEIAYTGPGIFAVSAFPVKEPHCSFGGNA